MPANAMRAEIYNAPGKQRMPAILHQSDHEAWLTASVDDAIRGIYKYQIPIDSINTQIESRSQRFDRIR